MTLNEKIKELKRLIKEANTASIKRYEELLKQYNAIYDPLTREERTIFHNSTRREYPFGMHESEWKRVACKRSVKRLSAELGRRGDAINVYCDVARTGTVYISLDWNDLCNNAAIRVADHPCYAGAWSWDGRTDNYTVPDAEIGRGATQAEIAATVADLGI